MAPYLKNNKPPPTVSHPMQKCRLCSSGAGCAVSTAGMQNLVKGWISHLLPQTELLLPLGYTLCFLKSIECENKSQQRNTFDISEALQSKMKTPTILQEVVQAKPGTERQAWLSPPLPIVIH